MWMVSSSVLAFLLGLYLYFRWSHLWLSGAVLVRVWMSSWHIHLDVQAPQAPQAQYETIICIHFFSLLVALLSITFPNVNTSEYSSLPFLPPWSQSHSVVSHSLWPHGIVHWILQARILEWVVVPFSRGSSQPRNRTQVSRNAGGFFIIWATREDSIRKWYMMFVFFFGG